MIRSILSPRADGPSLPALAILTGLALVGCRPQAEPTGGRAVAVAIELRAAVVRAQAPVPGAVEPPPRERFDEIQRLLSEKKDLARAEALARRLLDEVEAAHSRDSLPAADAHDLLVRALYLTHKRVEFQWRGEARSSIELARDALRLREALLDDSHHPSLAVSLRNLAGMLQTNQRLAEAEAALRRSLAIRRRAFGDDSLEVSESLTWLSSVLTDQAAGLHQPRRRARQQAAFELVQEALRIRERHLGSHPEVAQTLTTLAHLSWDMDEYRAAQEIYGRALAIYEATAEEALIARGLNNLGSAYHILGDSAAAYAHYRRALDIRRRLSGEDGVRTATSYTNLALLLHESGDLAGARSYFRKGLVGYEKGLKKGHPYYANALCNLALLVQESGDLVTAEHLHRQALQLRRAALGPRHAAVGRSQAWLGNLLLELGETGEAGELLAAALAIQEQTIGRRHPQLRDTLVGLARLRRMEGDPAVARRFLEQAIAIFERFDAGHPKLIEPLIHLARLDLSRGEIGGARQALARGLTIAGGIAGRCREASRQGQATACGPGSGGPQVARLRVEQSRVHFAAGRGRDALETALEANRVARGEVRRTVRALAERDALLFAEAMAAGRDLALTLLASDPSVPGAKVWDAVIRSRGLVLRETMARHRLLTTSDNPALRDLAARWHGKRQRLLELLAGGDGAGQRQLMAAAREVLAAEQALAEHSHQVRGRQASDEVGFEAVAAALPAGSALLAISRFEAFDPAATALHDGGARPAASYLAFVLAPGSAEPVALSLGPAAAIDAAVEALRQRVVPADDSRRAEDEFRAAGARLRELVWDPLQPHLAAAARVFVVPDGGLHLVNLATLPAVGGATGEVRYLLEQGPLIHHLTTERELVALATREPRDPVPARRALLAVGGVDFDDRAGFAALGATGRSRGETGAPATPAPAGSDGAPLRAGCGRTWYQSLPQTEDEIDELEAFWVSSSAASPATVLRLTREGDLKRLAPGHQVLHLATHGFFLGDECASGLAPGDASSVLSALSGLALAGANNRRWAATDEDDGVLTAGEIAALDLAGVEWAVLSACSTGIGEVRAGEGVFGLRRAFRVAGARTVIMSLWPVEDRSARQYMKALYAGAFEHRLDTAEAVRQASLEVLRSRRGLSQSTHPFYWGAFIAAGDWRAPPRPGEEETT